MMAQIHHASAQDEVKLAAFAATTLFLISLLLRLWVLRKASVKTSNSSIGTFKVCISLLLPLFSVARLVRYAGWTIHSGFIGVATPTASIVASIGYCILSTFEHRRSIRPSTPILLYLSALLICDVAVLAISLQRPDYDVECTISTSAVLLDLILLVTESASKREILLDSVSTLSPEETAGILSQTFFWWINPILALGYHNDLQDANLPKLEHKLSSALIREVVLRQWEQRGKPASPLTLPKVLLQTLTRPFLGAVLPRLCLSLFRYSQPVLIREAIRFLTFSNVGTESRGSFNIIAASVVIYVGLAISSAAYQRCINRLTVMTRAALISLIHHKTLQTGSDTLVEGKVVTLMSNDVDNLSEVASMFHGAWAQVVEVVIGIVLLAGEVGWLWPLPLVFIFFCSRVSRYVAQNLRGRQGAWNSATQDRISMTSAVLAAIKSVKMLGLQHGVMSYIERLRRAEMDKAGSVRWMMVAYNASANALGIFTPMITLALYAIVSKMNGRTLDAETAFTTTAILGMVTHPANMVMTIVPRAIASFSSFERIQKFLLEDDLVDTRQTTSSALSADDPSKGTAISLENVSVVNSSARLVLHNISSDIATGSICMCAGPTASGKTTLARAILGELRPSHGSISISSRRVAYCAQSTWLPSTTLKQAILSLSPSTGQVDENWYDEVIRACCLHTDIETMPGHDGTQIGSRGMNLSGGQRQRVALARALYSRPTVLILDDTLSGLDGNTEQQIISNLFGPKGLIRRLGTTVFLITNSAQHFHLANKVIILENATIKEQGSWDKLRQKQDEIRKAIANQEASASDAGQLTLLPSFKEQVKPELKTKSTKSRSEGDSALYGYYIRSTGYSNFAIMITCVAVHAVFVNLPQYWLKLWTESGGASTAFYAAGLVLITFTAWTSTNGIMWSTVTRLAPHSGLALHSKLLDTVLAAPLSFFSNTQTGETLNRFSQDIQLIDKQLAPAIQGLAVQICKLITQLVLIFIASKYMVSTLPLCTVVVWAVQKVYLRTSRQLRLLELESRSAVFNGFLETVEGITTIRAFQTLNQAEIDHVNQLDSSQEPFYLLFCVQNWLSIVLDLLVAAIAIGIIALAIKLRATGPQLGLSLNLILVANTTILSLVRSWTNLEISLGVISRLKSLEEDVASEDADADTDSEYQSESWPEPGAIELKSVTASYNPQVVALRNFSLQVDPGQLVILCGRTGRGKSSVLLSLLKMIQVDHGSVIVHGLNIKHIPTSVVREKFFVTIPQEATIFNQASLRFNLDPTEVLGNATIVKTLEKVRLLRHFQIPELSDTPSSPSSLDSAADRILNTLLSSLPTLSAGQAQLLALGRALLQVHDIAESGSKPIVLLDEATSSLDVETERLMLSIVHHELLSNGFTVIMIAHRLEAAKAIMREGVDRVIEM